MFRSNSDRLMLDFAISSTLLVRFFESRAIALYSVSAISKGEKAILTSIRPLIIIQRRLNRDSLSCGFKPFLRDERKKKFIFGRMDVFSMCAGGEQQIAYNNKLINIMYVHMASGLQK